LTKLVVFVYAGIGFLSCSRLESLWIFHLL